MGHHVDEDAPWSWWTLSLVFIALLLASTMVWGMLADSLGGRGPNEDRSVGATTGAVLGVVALAFKDDYTAVSDSLNEYAPWPGWELCLAFFVLLLVCVFASALLVDALGGRGPQQNGYTMVTTVVMLGVVVLASAHRSLSVNILRWCAPLVMSRIAAPLLVEALGLKDRNGAEYVCWIAAFVVSIRIAFAATIQSLLGEVLTIVAALVLGTISTWVIASALGGVKGEDGFHAVCVSIVALAGLFWAAFTYQSVTFCGWILLLEVLLVPLTLLVWRFMAVQQTQESNVVAVAADATRLDYANDDADSTLRVGSIGISQSEALDMSAQRAQQWARGSNVAVINYFPRLDSARDDADSTLRMGSIGVSQSEALHMSAQRAKQWARGSNLPVGSGPFRLHSAHGDAGSTSLARRRRAEQRASFSAAQQAPTCDVDAVNCTLQSHAKNMKELQRQIAERKRSLPTRGALMALAWYTGGLSKLIQIPYDIAVSNERRRLQKKFECARFRAADVYYCKGRDRVAGVNKLPAGLLMSKEDWKSAKTSILKKLMEAAKQTKHEVGNFKKKQKLQEMLSDGDLETSIEDFADDFLGDIDFVQSAVGEWAEVALEGLVDMIF